MFITHELVNLIDVAVKNKFNPKKYKFVIICVHKLIKII